MSQTKNSQQHGLSLSSDFQRPCPRHISHSVSQEGPNGESIILVILVLVVGLLSGTEARRGLNVSEESFCGPCFGE